MRNQSYINWLKGYAALRPKLKDNKVPHVVDGGGPDPVYYTQHFINAIKGLKNMFMVVQTYDHTFLFKSDNLIKQPMCRFMILTSFNAQNEADMIDKIDECEYEAEQIVAKIHKDFKTRVSGLLLQSIDLNEVNIEKLFLIDNKCGVAVNFPIQISHTGLLALDDEWL